MSILIHLPVFPHLLAGGKPQHSEFWVGFQHSDYRQVAEASPEKQNICITISLSLSLALALSLYLSISLSHLCIYIYLYRIDRYRI